MNQPPDNLEAAQVAAALVGGPVTGLLRIGGGRNSRVYRVDGPGRQRHALKLYFRHARDTRDRRATEFTGLRFLREQGVRCVPAPLATAASLGASVFGFVDGTPVPGPNAMPADADRLADFLIELH